MNLVRAEFDRLVARRFVQVMLALLIGAVAVTAATTLAASARPNDEQIATAQRLAAEDRAQAVQAYQACLTARLPGTPEEIRAQFPDRCEAPNLAEFRTEDHLPGAFVFEREIDALMYLLVAFLVLFGFLVGASFVGAELTSGGMLNLLLWESRRRRVLGTKLAVLLTAVAAVSVLGTVGYVAVFRLIAAVAGWPGRDGAGMWGSLVLAGVRGVVAALAAAAVGFAVATLGRHTAAALGVVAAYLVAWEAGARVVMTIVDVVAPERFVLSTYLVAWVSGSYDVYDMASCGSDYTDCVTQLSWGHAALVFGLILAALLAATFHRFDRRDLA